MSRTRYCRVPLAGLDVQVEQLGLLLDQRVDGRLDVLPELRGRLVARGVGIARAQVAARRPDPAAGRGRRRGRRRSRVDRRRGRGHRVAALPHETANSASAPTVAMNDAVGMFRRMIIRSLRRDRSGPRNNNAIEATRPGLDPQVKLRPDWALSRPGSPATRDRVTAVSPGPGLGASPPGRRHRAPRPPAGHPPLPDHRIFFPSNDVSSSTPSIAVWFRWSRTGFVSTNSAERTLPVSASISMARWASR